ncbi:hypothetical protein [Phytobacter diazotrophicus]|uniref:hypothetical protein n=1 Tax=Phytobacter diazotrophicus TaxID=395631 RepID=UPI002935A955|nr:hypothetical protein [Phytobacter diazotrophicus]MDV2874452.1 hypothetical protein [Phytobacter diazotrophicus]
MTTQLPIPKERLKEIAEDGFVAHGEIKAMTRALLAAHEQEPVAVVELSDFVTAAQLSGEEPRKKAVKELYEGALVVGQNLYANPAPVPAVPMAVAGFDAATAIRACMEEFPKSMHDIIEECAQIAENTISTSHAAPVPAVPAKWPEKLTWSHHEDMTQAEVLAWNNAIDACRSALVLVPAVPDVELIRQLKSIWWNSEDCHCMSNDTALKIIEACRAAMLNGGKS